MFNCNLIKQRCLVLSKDKSILDALENMLSKSGYIVDLTNHRKSALANFLQYRHSLVLLDEEFLPRYPHRLLQFFKAAHRTPGVIILRRSEKDLSGYCFLAEGIVEVINVPFKTEELVLTLKQADNNMRASSKGLFYKDLLIQVGLAIPIMLLLTVLLTR